MPRRGRERRGRVWLLAVPRAPRRGSRTGRDQGTHLRPCARGLEPRRLPHPPPRDALGSGVSVEARLRARAPRCTDHALAEHDDPDTSAPSNRLGLHHRRARDVGRPRPTGGSRPPARGSARSDRRSGLPVLHCGGLRSGSLDLGILPRARHRHRRSRRWACAQSLIRMSTPPARAKRKHDPEPSLRARGAKARGKREGCSGLREGEPNWGETERPARRVAGHSPTVV